MKTFNLSFKKLIPLLLTGIMFLIFISCGTHSNNKYDEADGIYSSNETSTVEEDTSSTEEDKNNYMKD